MPELDYPHRIYQGDLSEEPPWLIRQEDIFDETAHAREVSAWAYCPECFRPVKITRWQYIGLISIVCKHRTRGAQCPWAYKGDLREDRRYHPDVETLRNDSSGESGPDKGASDGEPEEDPDSNELTVSLVDLFTLD